MIQALIVFTIVSFLADKMALFLRNNNAFEKKLRLIQIITFIGIGIFILI